MPRVIEGEKIRIGKQIVLPLSKAVEISLKSLRIRFWRSMVTVSGVVLAIAFLVSILVSGAILEALIDSKDPAVLQTLREKGVPVDAAAAAPGQKEKREKTSAARIWLVVLSLVVAVIGIMNAMLMAVTERFREIGTMKCLGALDSFIVKLFLLESSFQGTAGTVIGILIGLLLTTLATMISYGAGPVVRYFPLVQTATYVLVALGIGILLSVVGAIWPARVAARMEPVAAMQQEV
jgi:predicted lysophospholipase L1 biosynthesis ABC-type transport system permease subunit